jgi:hypothetical protein
VPPGHTTLGFAKASKDNEAPILTLKVLVSLQLLLVPVTVYTVFTVGLTTINELLDPVFQL